MDEIVYDKRALAGLEALDAPRERGEDCVALETRETLADTSVDAVAKPELADVIAADVEALWILPLPLVAVAGRVRHHEVGIGGHRNTGNLDVALDAASEVVDRRRSSRRTSR